MPRTIFHLFAGDLFVSSHKAHEAFNRLATWLLARSIHSAKYHVINLAASAKAPATPATQFVTIADCSSYVWDAAVVLTIVPA